MTVINSPASTPTITAPERRPSRTSYVTMRVLMLVIGAFGVCAASYFGFVLDAALRVLAPPPVSPPLADGEPVPSRNSEDQRRETSSSDPSSLNNVAHP